MHTMVPRDVPQSNVFEVSLLPIYKHDDATATSMVQSYKEFRLRSLHLAPESFTSTYAIESQFKEETWQGRMSNPLARTFIAKSSALSIVDGQTEWIGMVTLLGPKPLDTTHNSAEVSPWTAMTSAASGVPAGPGEFWHYHL